MPRIDRKHAKPPVRAALRIALTEWWLVGEREVQPGGKDYVIILGADGRVRYIKVVKLILPAQPFADLRHRTQVELSAILATISARQVWIDIEFLRDHRTLSCLVHQFFAQSERGEFVRHSVGDVSWGDRHRRIYRSI